MYTSSKLISICCCYFITLTVLEASKECGVVPYSCPLQTDSYRTIDGSCNNKNNPSWGSSYSTYDRIMAARYGDGIKSITLSCDGTPLPNARYVRTQLLPDDKSILNRNWTRAFIGGLQFFIHDLSSLDTPAPADYCCTADLKFLSYPPDYCAPIDIPCDDIMQCEVGAECISVVIGKTNLDYQCSLTPQAQQISTTTHYTDLSPIYGSTVDQNYYLRTYHDGKLKTEVRNGYEYLPVTNNYQYECYIPCPGTDQCLVSGDPKVNQNPDLTTFNTLFVREHNRLCDGLKKVNPCWDDEKLFQEARKINIAIYEYIIYYELLSLLLGQYTAQNQGITPYYIDYVEDYDISCKANVFNEFAHYASRVLHALIRGELILSDEKRNPTRAVSLVSNLEHTSKFLESYDNFDENLRGICTQFVSSTGPYEEFPIANEMFLRHLKYGQDLISIDIHRARLHGMPTYNDIRVYCGFKKAVVFEDFEDFIPKEWVAKLKAVYKTPDDVDAYVGGRLENFVYGGVVGPTVQCILVKQFKRTRQCDRFWFEHKAAGFTPLQLLSIRSTSSLASITCRDSNNIKKMQKNAFLPVSTLNPLIDCAIYIDLDFSLWKDYSCY